MNTSAGTAPATDPVPSDAVARTCLALARAQARRTPDAPAVLCERDGRTHRVTHAELHARADRLARALRRAGARPEEPVAVLTARSEWTVSSLLGVLSAGAAFLPLTTEYPPERLRLLLADSGCRLVVADEAGRRAVPGLGDGGAGEPTVLAPDQPDLPGPGVEPDPGPGDLAALLYTSGSTGTPKGVLIEHGSLAGLVTGLQPLLYAPLGGRTVEALSAPFVFDAALQQTLSCLVNGGTLVVLDEHDRRDPHRFLELVRRHRVGLINVVAPFLAALVDAGLGRGAPSALRHIVTGGQAVPSAVVRRLLDGPAGGSLTVWSMYGPTETTVDATCLRVDRDTPLDGTTLGLGTPLPGVAVDVRDDQLRVLPPGRSGEICIGGTGLARGYLHPEQEGGARFVTDGPAGPRLYRTGDLGRLSETGQLEFLGRVDDQVKVRGHRVEPGEIGNVLVSCPGVTEAAVVAVPDGFGDRDLVAFYTAAGGVDEEALRRHARSHLPPWMVPSRFLRRTALPHTPNGKVDRAALAEQARAAAGAAEAPPCDPDARTAPGAVDEAELAALFGAVLGRPGLDPDEDFFAVGGHSLKAMRLTNRIAARWGVTVPLRTVHDHPTPRALARALADLAPSVGTGPGAHLPRAQDAEDYPLSYAQQRLWTLHQLGGSLAYNVPVVMDQGDLDRAALQEALAMVAGRHDSLRTCFTVRDGEPRQIVHDRIALPLRTVDVSDAPDPVQAAEEIVRAEAATPFDLAAAPLARVVVVRLAPRRCWLVLTAHHIVCDGWSIVVLSRELNEAYRAARRGQPAELPELPVRYRDFAVWDRSRDIAARAPAWRARLGGVAPHLPLPADGHLDTDEAFRGGTRAGVLDKELSARLRALAARSERTPAAVFLALFGWLLHRLTSLQDICIGMGSAARIHPDLEHLVGFFVNVLPIRLFPRPDMDFDAFADQASAALTAALEQQDCPIDVVVKDLNPRRTAGTQPLANVMFAYQNFADVFGPAPAGPPPGDSSDGKADGLFLDQSRLVDVPLDTAKFDLTLYVYDTADEFRVAFEYDGRLFRPATVDRYLAALERLARAVTMEVPA
ncbi:amino acid adenylation domain-containing protein [Streptomyces sp. NBC_00557]|uniref:amino acid adenylation domain-containing protein n=1 Tax=Streptomyces sp. NBC_00557 TaxID=2975776 RepID=UPI002E8009A5|nr:amino acid adenylation domain-containing protein [Streptomyces sp. NBC_00557]WUC39486.1 amino acid adenylation domain-containing protein [Streptomyces sp. NBC_00557]